MNDTRTIKDLVNKLRHIALKLDQENINIIFPSLYPSPAENAGPEFIDEVMPINEAITIIKDGGVMDASHAAALVHFIADMMDE